MAGWGWKGGKAGLDGGGGGGVVGKKKKKGEVGDDEVGRMEGGRRKGR